MERRRRACFLCVPIWCTSTSASTSNSNSNSRSSSRSTELDMRRGAARPVLDLAFPSDSLAAGAVGARENADVYVCTEVVGAWCQLIWSGHGQVRRIHA